MFLLSTLLLGLPAALPQDLAVEKYRLDNGLTVILYEDHSAPQACVNLWYGVGSKDEREGRSGFAHLFEHLMFMGSERVPEGQFDQIMEAGGGFNNATTSTDRTNYFDFGPAELLPTLLWLEADRLEGLGLAMTDAKLELQRQVVMNERRQRVENAPYGEVFPALQRLLYPPGHPYHHTTIGSMEDLAAATLDDVVGFFDTYYVPNNASLVVAGDFDPQAVRAQIDAIFGSLPRGAAVVHRTAETVTLEHEVRAQMTDQVQFARIVFGYHSPRQYAPGDAELDLVGAILSEGINGQLTKRLVVELELALDVAAFQLSRALGSMFLIQVTARPGADLARIEAEVDALLATFRQSGPSAEELARVQATVELGQLSRLESLLARADQLNEYEFFFGEPNSFERDLDRYRSATTASVREAADAVFSAERLVLTVRPDPGEVVNPRDARPAPGAPAPFEPPAPVSAQLSNGMDVHHWERRDLPLARVTLLLAGGAASDEARRAGTAYLVGEMLDEGAGGLSATEFQAALERLGAELDVSVGRTDTRITLSTLVRSLEPALALVAGAVRQPAFDQTEWDRVHELHAQDLLADQDDPSTVAARAVQRAFFGDDHPFGWPVGGTPGSVGAIDRDRARAFHQVHYRPSLARIVSAGAVPAAEMRALCERAFGDWQEGSAPAPVPPKLLNIAPVPLRVAYVDRPGAVQTAVRFAFPSLSRANEGRVARDVLGTLLGGSFTSRLNNNLREQHGYTYGARSSFEARPTLGWFQAGAAVRADVTGASVQEFFNEFRRLRGGDISAEDAAKACAVRRTGLVSTQSDTARLLDWAADRLALGEPWTALTDELAELESIRADQLNAMAAESVAMDSGVLLLVGDAETIRAQLAGLDLPDLEEVAITGERIPVRMR